MARQKDQRMTSNRNEFRSIRGKTIHGHTLFLTHSVTMIIPKFYAPPKAAFFYEVSKSAHCVKPSTMIGDTQC